jgi:GntR family transcriptional regulator
VSTERELALRMTTVRTTVRQALSELVVEGRLVRRQGSGTYVPEPKITWPLDLASFTEQVRTSGAAGAVVEFGRTWFRGDRVTLVTRLGSRRR